MMSDLLPQEDVQGTVYVLATNLSCYDALVITNWL